MILFLSILQFDIAILVWFDSLWFSLVFLVLLALVWTDSTGLVWFCWRGYLILVILPTLGWILESLGGLSWPLLAAFRALDGPSLPILS